MSTNTRGIKLLEKMVTPTCCAPSEAVGSSRRYSRPCPPYSLAYPDHRRFLSSHDNRAIIMSDREDSDQPRKRIAVACGRCRKRKIRCSGDPGNGGPCSNCKNAGHEPCLFLRVSSQETPLKDTSEYTYNIDAARAYGNPRGAAVSPMSPLPQYAQEMTGDGLTAYRQSTYPYTTSKGYYPNMSGWANTYQDDGGVDYSLNYSPYPIITQEPAPPLVSGYATATPYNTRKSVYVDPSETTPPYSYGNLVHRPAAVVGSSNSDTQGFSLSSMAASLPSASDRLHSSVNRTLTSSSSSTYRADGLPAYQNGKAATDVAYSALQPAFEPPYSTTTANALASAIAHRATAHADAAYPPATATADQQLYAPPSGDRADELSYVYSDAHSNARRRGDSHSHSHSHSTSAAAAGSLLSNGHVYVPESHHTAYVVPPSAPSAPSRSIDAASSSSSSGSASSSSTTTSGGGGSTGASQQRHRDDAHRRSAGSLRGG
ncbi:hypothetical protein F4859DRAFT_456212 [Xylaria cf. heliscus]|nr:hypothetical protein F4859DRAFT_456212 [Xylaria cf. heliscus]